MKASLPGCKIKITPIKPIITASHRTIPTRSPKIGIAKAVANRAPEYVIVEAVATASTITYSGALFATAFAIPILGERVGIVRWLAVIIGFIGVIFILQPGSDAFTHYSILQNGIMCEGVTTRL